MSGAEQTAMTTEGVAPIDTALDEQQSLFTQLLRLADDHLVLGHRLSEWCGHAPMLEEDLALPNIALDLLGQARALYTYAGIVEDTGRDEDALAYRRLEREYVNVLICERANGDFAHTMLRQYFFSVFMEKFWLEAQQSTDTTIAAIAAKACKESNYHVRHCAQWTIRLGDGTDESARRLTDAMQALGPYLNELFESDTITQSNAQRGVLPDPVALQASWHTDVNTVLNLAKLPMPDAEQLMSIAKSGGRRGRHTEQMGLLLTQLQFLQQTYPNMQW